MKIRSIVEAKSGKLATAVRSERRKVMQAIMPAVSEVLKSPFGFYVISNVNNLKINYADVMSGIASDRTLWHSLAETALSIGAAYYGATAASGIGAAAGVTTSLAQ